MLTTTLLLLLQKPLPIAIKELPETHPDVWIVLGAIASAIVAIFTAYLAQQTKRLADKTTLLAGETQRMAVATVALATETRQTITVAQLEGARVERHHQQSLSPVLVVRRPIVRYLGNSPEYGHKLEFRAEAVTNIGFGPALQISYEIRITGQNISGVVVSPTASLAQESSIGPEIIYVHAPSNPNDPKINTGPIDAIVLITYFNVFNNYRVTKYEITQPWDRPSTIVEIITPQQISDNF